MDLTTLRRELAEIIVRDAFVLKEREDLEDYCVNRVYPAVAPRHQDSLLLPALITVATMDHYGGLNGYVSEEYLAACLPLARPHARDPDTLCKFALAFDYRRHCPPGLDSSDWNTFWTTTTFSDVARTVKNVIRIECNRSLQKQFNTPEVYPKIKTQFPLVPDLLLRSYILLVRLGPLESPFPPPALVADFMEIARTYTPPEKPVGEAAGEDTGENQQQNDADNQIPLRDWLIDLAVAYGFGWHPRSMLSPERPRRWDIVQCGLKCWDDCWSVAYEQLVVDAEQIVRNAFKVLSDTVRDFKREIIDPIRYPEQFQQKAEEYAPRIVGMFIEKSPLEGAKFKKLLSIQAWDPAPDPRKRDLKKFLRHAITGHWKNVPQFQTNYFRSHLLHRIWDESYPLRVEKVAFQTCEKAHEKEYDGRGEACGYQGNADAIPCNNVRYYVWKPLLILEQVYSPLGFSHCLTCDHYYDRGLCLKCPIDHVSFGDKLVNLWVRAAFASPSAYMSPKMQQAAKEIVARQASDQKDRQ